MAGAARPPGLWSSFSAAHSPGAQIPSLKTLNKLYNNGLKDVNEHSDILGRWWSAEVEEPVRSAKRGAACRKGCCLRALWVSATVLLLSLLISNWLHLAEFLVPAVHNPVVDW